MVLVQEAVPKKVVLVLDVSFGSLVVKKGEVVLYQGRPDCVLNFIIGYRKGCPGQVDLRINSDPSREWRNDEGVEDGTLVARC